MKSKVTNLESWAVSPQPITPAGSHYFFGYFDKCPWDRSQRYVLAHRVGFEGRMPTPDDEIEIGVVDVGECVRMAGETSKMRLGVPAPLTPDPPDALYERVLPRPVAAISRDGRWAGCLNFARLHDMRPGYGYCNAPDVYKEKNAPENDGLEIMDMHTGKTKQLVSLAELAGTNSLDSMRGTKHWINHILFSPSGERMIFLHRWDIGAGRHQTRCYTIGHDGKDLYCINDDVMTSHFDWEDDSHIIAFARQHGKGDKYFRFEDKPGFGAAPQVSGNPAQVIGDRELSHLGDGHCTVSPNGGGGEWMLTDTYPDKDMIQRLFLYNFQTQKKIEIGRFKALPSETPMRCDLHPRFSHDGKQVCIDSTCEGYRRMYVINVDGIVRG